MKYSAGFAPDEHRIQKSQMLNWASRFNICVLLDNHGYDSPHQSKEWLLAVGATAVFQPDSAQTIDAFMQMHQGKWIFGHISYEYGHQLMGKPARTEDFIGFPLLQFFCPEIVIECSNNYLTIFSDTQPIDTVLAAIQSSNTTHTVQRNSVQLTPTLSKAAYVQAIQSLQAHISRGDCYEINYCQQFAASGVSIDPVQVYHQLSTVSPTPFAAFYRNADRYLLCASPERFLKKAGQKLISQPIKGTFKRNLQDATLDDMLKNALQGDPKERSENVMVVDLVRNDLSRVCLPGSVHVTELFGVYSFPQVHQMISTIEGSIKPSLGFSALLKALFPMGSMTGAPKEAVMNLIDRYEPVPRGLYSGTIGYISPNGDFDFNVVIRSIVYNATKQHISYHTGSGITYYADAEKEYQECLLKAEAMSAALS
jgi:para-aminobenzoate synthetase component 1